MTPYYSRGGITLFHGDALEVLPRLNRKSAHMLLTDPPYGVGMRSHGNARYEHDLIEGDESTETGEAVLRACPPIIVDKRHVYAFGPFDLERVGYVGQCELIWSKRHMSGGDWSSAWGPSHERIAFATMPIGKGRGGGPARLRKGSVLSFTRPRAVLHPTQKPVDLLRELIESSSRIGETVLDPFAGSGSTLVAALIEGRKAIGVEIEERYCEVAARRLDALLDQGSLFTEAA